MKRIGHLFERAFTHEALFTGFADAAKSKRGRRAAHEFTRCLGSHLSALHDELHAGTYRPRPYATFEVREPKPRVIYAPAFRDCVVQHAIYNVVRPIFDRCFIDQSYACRPGRGTHAASDYAQRALQASDPASYTLQLDIRKFFYRIDRAVLRRLIERKIKDARLVDVMMLFADHGEPVGIPIGNLLSQLYALTYLNPLDHFVKRELGVRHYCRYVDDFILFGLTRDEAISHRARITDFLHDALRLELSRATIARTRRGVNFVGYRTWARARFVRRRSLRNFHRATRAGRTDSIAAILGHARRTHSLQHLLRHLETHHHDLYRQLPKGCQPTHHHPDPSARR